SNHSQPRLSIKPPNCSADNLVSTPSSSLRLGRSRTSSRVCIAPGNRVEGTDTLEGRQPERPSSARSGGIQTKAAERGGGLGAWQGVGSGRTRRRSRRRGQVAILEFIARSAPAAAELVRSANGSPG